MIKETLTETALKKNPFLKQNNNYPNIEKSNLNLSLFSED